MRYNGHDTPETHFGTECYGPEATARNRALIGGQLVAPEQDVSHKTAMGGSRSIAGGGPSWPARGV